MCVFKLLHQYWSCFTGSPHICADIVLLLQHILTTNNIVIATGLRPKYPTEVFNSSLHSFVIILNYTCRTVAISVGKWHACITYYAQPLKYFNYYVITA